ncbi:alpha-L-fucosidase [Thalassotalea fonticola]|uniref:alpha-L-fucosidase n=1 Tax=Thalassotalea fonticola TaxID=3065649 RepID=A0ABZ0GVD1_9GAMM|nr:alpha-L-fucosidase [Colwelliaceae bacterium S1-1]
MKSFKHSRLANMTKLTVLVSSIFGITACSSTLPAQSNSTQSNSVETFEATISSLQNYSTPEWFRDAKLGIYLHWGPYSVAEVGEWYPRHMYLQGREEYNHHVKTYGHPSEFGYKDLIPLWKAENFDPDALVGLFKKAGAKYFTPVAVHHDNFDLWDSKHQEWNSVNHGPKKDLTGMWREATLKHGLRFGVTTHLSRSYSWLNTSKLADTTGDKTGVPYDGNDAEFSGLYHEKHSDTHPRAALNPPKAWRDQWALRMKDLIDKYQPDHFYFDSAVPFRGEDNGQTGMDVIAHLYNTSIKNHDGKQEAVMAIKERPWQAMYDDGMATLDYERGKASHILPEPWQTDDSIGDWGYRKKATYMETNLVIDKFIDIVSKNGNLLLNIPIKADGTLDQRATTTLEEMGEWMTANGEGIYGSRPWYLFGEGKVNEIDHKAQKSPYTSKDIRFTTKGDTIYAYVLQWPGAGKTLRIRNITEGNMRIGLVENVTMLGSNTKIKWSAEPDGLEIIMPKKPASEFAHGFKINFKSR